jgi:hypothetical protein
MAYFVTSPVEDWIIKALKDKYENDHEWGGGNESPMAHLKELPRNVVARMTTDNRQAKQLARESDLLAFGLCRSVSSICRRMRATSVVFT